MLVTDFTRGALRNRRGRAALKAEGFIPVSDNGAPLWMFDRGDWIRRHITDVRIGPDRKTLWIKVSPENAS